jgi:hypothetical protein
MTDNKWQVASGGGDGANSKFQNPKSQKNSKSRNSKNARDAEAAGALIPAF